MRLFDIGSAAAEPALRALKTVAAASGGESEEERTFLHIAAELYGAPTPPEDLPPIGGDELARAVVDPADRKRLLQACIVVALADGDASREEALVLDEFRRALDVDESLAAVFGRIAEGHMTLARVEVLRRLSLPLLKQAYARGGLGECYRFVRIATGHPVVDPALAARYRELEALPAGTLGRAYCDHVHANGFGYPGEAGGFVEATVNHDFTHALTGYGGDPRGELELGAFTAGMRHADPFPTLFFVLLQFHAGVKIAVISEADRGFLDPAALVRALERGSRTRVDLADRWDHWAVVDRPVAELCASYGIGP